MKITKSDFKKLIAEEVKVLLSEGEAVWQSPQHRVMGTQQDVSRPGNIMVPGEIRNLPMWDPETQPMSYPSVIDLAVDRVLSKLGSTPNRDDAAYQRDEHPKDIFSDSTGMLFPRSVVEDPKTAKIPKDWKLVDPYAQPPSDRPTIPVWNRDEPSIQGELEVTPELIAALLSSDLPASYPSYEQRMSDREKMKREPDLYPRWELEGRTPVYQMDEPATDAMLGSGMSEPYMPPAPPLMSGPQNRDDMLQYYMREAIKQTKQRTKQMKITKQEIIDLISEELKSVVQEDKYSRPAASEYPGGKLGTAKVPAPERVEPETYVGGSQVGQAVTPPVQVAEPESKPVSNRDDKEFPDLTGDGKVTQADILKGRGVELKEENELEEAEGIFAPNHYCVHHGGVNHNGSIQMAEAVNHNYNEELGRVTHYDMKLEDGTVLESVPFEEIQVTKASLAKEHKHSAMQRDDEDEENLEEESELNENLLESKKASAVSWSDVRDSFSKLLK